jgi:hypothetical protein
MATIRKTLLRFGLTARMPRGLVLETQRTDDRRAGDNPKPQSLGLEQAGVEEYLTMKMFFKK